MDVAPETPAVLAFDWKNPDYLPVWQKRARLLQQLHADPALVADFKLHYKTHPWDFVNDWGVTVDPRVAGQPGRTPLMPFLLMPRQYAWCKKAYECWQAKKPMVTVKSRDCGLSWLFMGWSVAMCLHWADFRVGVGSAKEDKVDRSGDPDCLFYKARLFLRYTPWIFTNGWHVKRNSQHMVLTFPKTESSITGEAGDNIGRGGRTSVYGIDESAHVERPKLIDASLSATTDCRMDISSVNGSANSFAERAHNAVIERFDFHWRDDPRKDNAWYAKKCAELDPVVVAQEIDCSFSASVEGIIIPQTHVQAALDADVLLGITPTGVRVGSLDVADQGMDKCALGARHGFLFENVQSWRGIGVIDGREWEVKDSVTKAFFLADEWRLASLIYDADGLGANVRGDARQINDDRKKAVMRTLLVSPFRGSGGVIDPEKPFSGTERKAIDYFENYKAQAWWWLRQLFRNTYRAIQYHKEHGKLPPGFNPNEIIVLRDKTPEIRRLCMELSQPVWVQSKTGKVMVDKQPDGVASPNLADTVMMAFAPKRLGVVVRDSHLELSNEA